MVRKGIVVVAAFVVFAFFATVARAEAPDMTGTWVGTVVGARMGTGLDHAPKSTTPAFSAVDFTMKIEKQQGQAFYGTTSSKKSVDAIVGVVSEDGKHFYIADDDVVKIGTIKDADTVEIITVGAGKHHRLAAAAVFTRKK
jgi:hypothetical protein